MFIDLREREQRGEVHQLVACRYATQLGLNPQPRGNQAYNLFSFFKDFIYF